MKRVWLLTLLIILSGCAANIETVKQDIASRVDPVSIKDQDTFQRDLQECATFAIDQQNRFRNQVLARSLIGAALGAGLGAATGSIYNSRAAGQGAGLGAAYGAVGGAGTARSKVDIVTGNCLIHRGYLLLW
jgi:hypothetical protein